MTGHENFRDKSFKEWLFLGQLSGYHPLRLIYNLILRLAILQRMLVGLLQRSLAIMLRGTVNLGHFQIYLHLRSVLLEALFLLDCSGLDSQLLVH